MSRTTSSDNDRPTPETGFSVEASRKPLDELLTVASAASRSGTSVNFTGTEQRSLEELVRLAAAGGEHVSFASRHRDLEAPGLAAEPTPAPQRSFPFRSLFGRIATG